MVAVANRLVRRGSWSDSATAIGGTFRDWNVPWHRDFSLGCRIVRPLVGSPQP